MQKIVLTLKRLFNNRKFRIGFESTMLIGFATIIGLNIYYLVAPTNYSNLEYVLINSNTLAAEIDSNNDEAKRVKIVTDTRWLQINNRLNTIRQLIDFVILEFAKLVKSDIKEEAFLGKEDSKFIVNNSELIVNISGRLLNEIEQLSNKLEGEKLNKEEVDFFNHFKDLKIIKMRGELDRLRESLEYFSKRLSSRG